MYLETHSKRRYKICICSVILGQPQSFRNYQGFSIIFPKIFTCNLTNYEGENFSDSSFHHILESENFRFPFFENFTRMERSSRTFFAVLKLDKILGNICVSEQIFYRKQSFGAPEKVVVVERGTSVDWVRMY